VKVAWFDTENWEREFLQDRAEGLEIEFFEESLTRDTVEKVSGFDAVTVFVESQVSSEVLEKLDADFVACRSTGYDHVDLEAADKQEITVFNVPDYGGTTVAEHAFGLILALSRKIYSAVRKVDRGEFDHQGLRGFDLKGKTLGVIGTGSIGLNAIRIANGFDMHVIASDPYPDHDAAEELGFMYVSDEDLVRKADIITVHCPLTDKTRHMLSEEEFKQMDGTLIVNTARGEVIDTEALIEALENGSVEAAGLDVLEEECYIEDDIEYLGDLEEKCDPQVILEDHILMNRDDVLITPHNAFNSREALERIEETTLRNLREKENPVN
jgi:D-lactate dehydrogenase